MRHQGTGPEGRRRQAPSHQPNGGILDLRDLLVACQGATEIETALRWRALSEIAALSTEHLCELAFAVDQRRDRSVNILQAAAQRRNEAV